MDPVLRTGLLDARHGNIGPQDRFLPINRLIRLSPEAENGRGIASFARAFLPIAFPFAPAIVFSAA